MRAKLMNLVRSREWGRGATGIGTSSAVSTKPNMVRSTQNVCATPPPSTRSARESGRAARRSDRARFPVISSAREQSRAVLSEHLPRLFKNPRSARRDHFLMILARNRIEFEAVPVGLDALAPTPKVRLAGPLHARVAATAVAVVAGTLLLATPALALSKHTSKPPSPAPAPTPSPPADVEVDRVHRQRLRLPNPLTTASRSSPRAATSSSCRQGSEQKKKTEEFAEAGNPNHITEAEQNVCSAEPGEECRARHPGLLPGAFVGASESIRKRRSSLPRCR